MKSKHIKKVILWAALVLLIIANIKQCRENIKNKKEYENSIGFLTDTLQIEKNKKGQMIASITALQGENEKLKLINDENVKELVKKQKEIDAAGAIDTKTVIDTVQVIYEKEIPCKFKRTFNKKDKWYSIKGNSTHKGIYIDSIQIPNTLSFVIGRKKEGFFKSSYKISVMNSNPYIQTTGIQGYTLRQSRKRFNFSLQGGYGLMYSGNQIYTGPYIGVGFNFNIFGF